MTCLLYWLTGFRGEDFKTFFPIGSYVKIMSAEGGHLGWRSGLPDTILKIDNRFSTMFSYGGPDYFLPDLKFLS